MDRRILDLESATFLGRRLTRQQIADIREPVTLLRAISRYELAQTVCERMHWQIPPGKIGSRRARRCLNSWSSSAS